MTRYPCKAFYSCLLLLVCLMALHGAPVIERWDLALLKGVQSFAGPGLDTMAIGMAVVGGPFVSLLVIFGLSIMHWSHRWKRAMLLFWGLFVLLTGFEVLSKTQIEHPRPPKELRRKIEIAVFLRSIPDVTIPTNNSFPSGHCLRAVFLMGIAAMLLGSRRGFVRGLSGAGVIAYIIIACWSRVYLGVHWPSDVIGGVLLGSLGLLIYSRATQQYFPRHPLE